MLYDDRRARIFMIALVGLVLIMGAIASPMIMDDLHFSKIQVTLDAEGGLIGIYYPPSITHESMGVAYDIFTADGARHLSIWPEVQRIGGFRPNRRHFSVPIRPEWIAAAHQREALKQADAVLVFIGYDEDAGSLDI